MENENYLISFEQVEQALNDSHLPVNPAYLHGFWCGLIAGGQYCKPQDWLDIAFSEINVWERLSKPAQVLLLQLAEHSVIEMMTLDFSFQPLLPAEEASLEERAYALNEWSLGVVIGLQNQQGQQTLLTGDGAQALADLTKISEMDFSIVECEEEEFSYAELVEFVRVAMLLIHQNLLEGEQAGQQFLGIKMH